MRTGGTSITRGGGQVNEGPDLGEAPEVPGTEPGRRADETIVSWLGSHAEALVGAVNPNGEPVEWPAPIELGSGHKIDPRSLLDLVIADDLRAVTDAFVAALVRGLGVAKIHLSSDPSKPYLAQYLDMRETYGVILRFVVPASEFGDDTVGSDRALSVSATRPRLCVITKSEVASILGIDEATSLMLGWSLDEMVGRSTLEFIHPDDHVRAIDNWMSRFATGREQSIQTVRLRYLRKDGTWLWVETSNDFQNRHDGSTVAVSQLIDVSEEMAATEALRYSERFLREVTDTVPVGLFHVARDGKVAFVNPVLRQLIGDVAVLSYSDLARSMSDEASSLEGAIEQVMTNGIDAGLSMTLAGESGPRSVMVTLRGVKDDDRVLGVLGCIVDVTDLKNLADTDVLTGLQNRRSIVELLEAELIRQSGNVSVIFADLDCFKQVNDKYGHQVGDQLLAAVATKLSGALRPGDRIGRLGGDEFLIFCPGVTDPESVSAIARRLREALDDELYLPGVTVHVFASLGIACGGPEATVDDLISRSDAAMYESKQARATAAAEMEKHFFSTSTMSE
jgi:diguanylate cyclase (GGDEF)-like protein/PAS domain S-box-containing protein